MNESRVRTNPGRRIGSRAEDQPEDVAARGRILMKSSDRCPSFVILPRIFESLIYSSKAAQLSPGSPFVSAIFSAVETRVVGTEG